MSRAVYLLERSLDDPRYEGFAAVRQRGFLRRTLDDDFLPPPPWDKWEAPRLAGVWKPVKVTGRVRKFNDYPCVNMGIPAFSRRAVDALRDLLEPNGELLPLVSDIGEYWAYNVTTVADVLDRERSTFNSTGSVVERYWFHGERLHDLTIFRITYDPIGVFVTDVFAERVRRYDLKGFNPIHVWPLERNESWWTNARRTARAREREGLQSGQTTKGNSIVIRLFLDGKGRKGSKDEQERINRLMDELDALLVDADSTAPAVGSFEGHEYVNGECRLFLSCPDADALVERLRAWFGRLDWPAGYRVLKRYGEYVDPDAPEEYVEDV